MQSSDATNWRSLRASVKTTCNSGTRAGPVTPRACAAPCDSACLSEGNRMCARSGNTEDHSEWVCEGHGLPYARFGAWCHGFRL
jgi:hypothetical protein